MTIIGLFFNASIRTGGHRRYLSLLNGLAAKGHRVILVCNSDCVTPVASGVMTVRLRVSKKKKIDSFSRFFYHTAHFALNELVTSVRLADAVLVFGETHFRAANLISNSLRAPLVFGFRSNSFRAASSFFAAIKAWSGELRVALGSDRIVFQSKYDRDDFIRRFPFSSEKSAVVGNAYIEPWFPNPVAGSHRCNERNKMLFVGNCSSRKGLSDLIAALDLLRKRGVMDFMLDVAGPCDGSAAKGIRESIARSGLEGSIRFLGPRADVFDLMASSGLLIVPSKYDSYPNVILEALFVGLPVIATRTGGVPEMLGPDGLLVPPGNPAALAEALSSVLSTPAAYDGLRSACVARRSLFEFDWVERWETELRKAKKNG